MSHSYLCKAGNNAERQLCASTDFIALILNVLRIKERLHLLKTRAMAVDMETATLFTCGFANHIPTGALLLVSDNPMTPEGVKTSESDRMVTRSFVHDHVQIGISALELIRDNRTTVKHLKFDW